ncbi:hypothetical protein [Nocardia wallacei]|uniref:hypothetical protein n=1 Tax=Nocardia wallacei TaxID=480035 RepID=UPI0024540C05|nr:hypothetical protein [Nocardia wallacei]
MPTTPSWVRRNRVVAWLSYFGVLVAFATLAMALTAAGSGHQGWALLSGGICTATVIIGLTLYGTTVHRDHADRHAAPSLLNDCWEHTPTFAHQRGPAPRIAARPTGSEG